VPLDLEMASAASKIHVRETQRFAKSNNYFVVSSKITYLFQLSFRLGYNVMKPLRTLGLLAVTLLISNFAQAAEVKCGAESKGYLDFRLSYEVAGTGRLYLYTGPDEKCLDKSLFVVPGDSLVAYDESGPNGKWSYVMYIAKNGKDYNGWVLTKRLKFTGAFGDGMSPKDIAFFQKAAEAAKNGKLGRPE